MYRYLLLSFLVSCGTTSYKANVVKNQEFRLSSTITVTSQGNDSLGARGIFEHHLSTQGFNVVAEEVAQEISKIDVDVTRNNKQKITKLEGKFGNYKNYKSAYAVKFSYSTRADTGYERVFSNLSASVFNLKTGKLVCPFGERV